MVTDVLSWRKDRSWLAWRLHGTRCGMTGRVRTSGGPCKHGGMDIAGVDPRGISWEVELPVYRVYFWGPPGLDVAAACDERRVTGAGDVEEVLRWAHREAEGRVFVVYVEAGDGGERGLLRLYGKDPSVSGDGPSGVSAVATG